MRLGFEKRKLRWREISDLFEVPQLVKGPELNNCVAVIDHVCHAILFIDFGFKCLYPNKCAKAISFNMLPKVSPF